MARRPRYEVPLAERLRQSRTARARNRGEAEPQPSASSVILHSTAGPVWSGLDPGRQPAPDPRAPPAANHRYVSLSFEARHEELTNNFTQEYLNRLLSEMARQNAERRLNLHELMLQQPAAVDPALTQLAADRALRERAFQADAMDAVLYGGLAYLRPGQVRRISPPTPAPEQRVAYPWQDSLPGTVGTGFTFELLSSLVQMELSGARLENCLRKRSDREAYWRKILHGRMVLADFRTSGGKWAGCANYWLPSAVGHNRINLEIEGPRGGSPSRKLIMAAHELAGHIHATVAYLKGPVVVAEEMPPPGADGTETGTAGRNPGYALVDDCGQSGRRQSGRTTAQLRQCRLGDIYVVLPGTRDYTENLVNHLLRSGELTIDVPLVSIETAARAVPNLRSLSFVVDHAVLEARESRGMYARELVEIESHNARHEGRH